MNVVERLEEHFLQDATHISWGGGRFYVKIELKGTVTAANDPHDERELAAHIECTFDMVERLMAAADAGGRELELMFEAENLAMTRALPVHPRWPSKHASPSTRLRLVANGRSPDLAPTDLESLTTDANDTGIDVLVFHASRLPDGMQQSYLSLQADLMLWMLDASVETMYAVDVYQPKYISTSEAELFRRWEEF
jgi:hypothetical protein